MNLRKYGPVLLACLTIGLAPFAPEPHIVGKVRWILGGGEGMTVTDWFDTLMHGAPWLILLFMPVYDFWKRRSGHGAVPDD